MTYFVILYLYTGTYNDEIDFVMDRKRKGDVCMMMANVTQCHKCAFCKHWYDPANSHIQPKSPRINLWLYDHQAKSYCDVKRIEMKGGQFCSEYECKM